MKTVNINQIEWQNELSAVPDCVHQAILAANEKILAEPTPKKHRLKKKAYYISSSLKVAIIFGILLLLFGTTALSVKAYISHLNKIKSMKKEEIIDLYENVLQYNSNYMSRALSEEEEARYDELYDLYCNDMAEPEGEAIIISKKDDYKGQGVAFSTEDGILYIPERPMTDEELLQMIVFYLIDKYIDYEAYIKASNPLYYMNYLEQLSDFEVDEIYRNYSMSNAETSFYSRELSAEENEKQKILKKLYKEQGMIPEHMITIINDPSERTEDDIYFCTYDCTYYFPVEDMNNEQILELLDFKIKVEYCFNRINEEVENGIRSDWPKVDYVIRERIETIDTSVNPNCDVKDQPWLLAYVDLLNQRFENYRKWNTGSEAEGYYQNVRFIYLNDDEIPELVVSGGNTFMDYDQHGNVRNYLYTYKDGEAVMLSAGEDTVDDFYGYFKPFSYAERKSMVYCDYYYMYGFGAVENENGEWDFIYDQMSRIDIWNLDDLTLTTTNSNIMMEHAVYDYFNESYEDADIYYEYYVDVSDIIRDEDTSEVLDIVGKKVDKQTYEEYEKLIWNGNEITTLSVSDFDKIYQDYDLNAALVSCYLRIQSNRK